MTHRPSIQIERELQELRRKVQLVELPALTSLESEVLKQTTKAALDPNCRPDLHNACEALRKGQEVWANRAKDNTSIKLLENELNESMAAERMERIAVADEQLQQAIDQYQHAALAAAKSYRVLLNAQRVAGQTPGASYNLSPQLLKFDVGFLHGISNQGTLGEAMRQGPVQFENDRHLRAAA